MKHFKNMGFGLLTIGAVVLCFNACTVKSFAQAEESNDPSGIADPSEVLVISALPETVGGEEASHAPWPEKLGLTDDQMEQLVSLKSDYEVETAKTKAELKANMKKMMLLMTDPKLDKQAVLSLHEKINQLKSNLSEARVNHMISVMNVMTPKQREEMHHHMLVHSLCHQHSWGKEHKPGPHKMHHSA